MATFFDEERFITENTTLMGEKLKSPLVRFIDQTPTFTTYFHLNVAETTSDEGWHDVEAVVGKKSPIRYQRIASFPIYGIDQIVPQIQDGDMGLDTSFEGEATILPGTIKPLQNDFFIIGVLDECFIFRVTGIEYDSARLDNFYKIHYKLEYNDAEKLSSLEEMVHAKYTCVLQNIGTENQCLIQSEYKDQLDHIDEIYTEIARLYLSVFYVEKYNVLLGELGNGLLLYDPFMTTFINEHGLFTNAYEMRVVYLNDEFRDPKRKLKYERSIYRFAEKRECSRMCVFPYVIFKGTSNCETSFYSWSDESVYMVDIPPYNGNIPADSNARTVLTDQYVSDVRMNIPNGPLYKRFLTKFFRKDTLSIFDITDELKEDIYQLDGGLEMFFLIPILLYAIRDTVSTFHENGYDIDLNAKNDIAYAAE